MRALIGAVYGGIIFLLGSNAAGSAIHGMPRQAIVASEQADSESGCLLDGSPYYPAGHGSVTCYIVPGGHVTVPLASSPYTGPTMFTCTQTSWEVRYAPNRGPYSGITASLQVWNGAGASCRRVDNVTITISRSENSPRAGPKGTLLTVITGQGTFQLCAPCLTDSEALIAVKVVEGPYTLPTPVPRGFNARR